MQRFKHTLDKKTFYVNRIDNMWYSQRLFMIIERNLPWELYIKYKEPHNSLTANPIIGYGFTGAIFQNEVRLHKEYCFRMQSKEQCLNHIKIINEKKELYDQHFFDQFSN